MHGNKRFQTLIFSIASLVALSLSQQLAYNPTSGGVVSSNTNYQYGAFTMNLRPNFESGVSEVFGLHFQNTINSNGDMFVNLKFQGDGEETNTFKLEINGNSYFSAPISITTQTVDEENNTVTHPVNLNQTWSDYTIQIFPNELTVLCNSTIVFNSVQHSIVTESNEITEIIQSLNSIMTPYLAIWMHGISQQTDATHYLRASSFKYQSQNNGVNVSDNFQSKSGWSSQTILIDQPFFIYPNDNRYSTILQNNFAYMEDGASNTNLAVILKSNYLSLSEKAWSILPAGSATITPLVDESITNTPKFTVNFNTIGQESLLIVNKLDVALANTTYSLRICSQFSMTNMNPDITTIPVHIYMRQQNYPYKTLTKTQQIQIPVASDCTDVTLVTPILVSTNYSLKMDLANYGSLVIEFNQNDYKDQDLTGTKVSFSTVKLTVAPWNGVIGGPFPANPTVTTKTTPTPIIIVKNEEVSEGWESKLSGVRTGFGIFIALIIILLIAVIALFLIRSKRIKQSQEQTTKLQAQLSDLDQLIETGQAKLRNNTLVRTKDTQQYQQQREKLCQYVQEKIKTQSNPASVVKEKVQNGPLADATDFKDIELGIDDYKSSDNDKMSPGSNIKGLTASQRKTFAKKKTGHASEESSMYLHEDDKTNTHGVFTIRDHNTDMEPGQVSDGDEE